MKFEKLLIDGFKQIFSEPKNPKDKPTTWKKSKLFEGFSDKELRKIAKILEKHLKNGIIRR